MIHLFNRISFYKERKEKVEIERFIVSNATTIGDVILSEDVTIWYQAVLCGGSNWIKVRQRTNIQNDAIVHVDHDAPVDIAENVTVGHQCMLHDCTIEKGALVGMETTILNHAVIGENSLIGAGSLITEGKIVPSNVLVFGRPAKVIRPLTKEEIQENKENIQHYVEIGRAHAQGKFREQR